jgi:tRNA(fMet)-specific endonuclease VapC
MTEFYVLDTDHITLLQRNHPAVISRFTALPPEVIAVTVVSAMEQMRGRLAQIHRATTAPEVVNAFTRFQEALHFYRTVSVLPYDETAAAHFARLRQVLQHRPGTQDLRIAAIALSHGATLVTRNQRDFEGISGLQLEDWSLPTL